jgi:hypothetical protein
MDSHESKSALSLAAMSFAAFMLLARARQPAPLLDLAGISRFAALSELGRSGDLRSASAWVSVEVSSVLSGSSGPQGFPLRQRDDGLVGKWGVGRFLGVP